MISTMDVDEDEFVFDDELILCIKQKNDEQAKEIFKNENYPVNRIDGSGNSLLHYSAQYSNDEMVKYFIDLGAAIDAQNLQGKTPLLLAIESHNFYNWDVHNWETIVNLFDAKANMHIRDNQGRSPLRNILAKKNSSNLLSLSLEKLNDECSGNSQQIARKLIEAKCSVYDALHLKNAEVTRIVFASGCVLDPPYAIADETVFSASVCMNHLENVRVLLDHGADPNAESQYHATPMMAYSRIQGKNPDPEILQLLLDRGANPVMILTTGDHGGRMQMYGVLSSCNAESIRVLLRSNVDLDARDGRRNTAIHYVVQNRRPNVFHEFDDKNFNTNARNNLGYTPIRHAASWYGAPLTVDVVRFLLNKGADPDAQCPRGLNALMLLMSVRRGVRVRRLRQFSSDVERGEQIIAYLLYRGADPQVVTTTGNTVFNNTFNFRGIYKGKGTVIAHLALLEARGTPIRQILLDQMDADVADRNALQVCRQELEIMKKIKVWKSLTLHELLIGGEVKLRLYVREYDFGLRLSRLGDKYTPMYYYCYTMREKISRIYFLHRLREKSVVAMCTVTGICLESYYYIIDKILSYLTERDSLNFCQVI